MKSFLYISILLISISGCVSIEAPAHLLSDTIDAGKDAYHSVKESMSDDSEDSNRTFSYQYIIVEDEPLGVSSGKCIDLVIKAARKKLNVYNITVNKSTIYPDIKENNSTLKCKVIISTQK